MPIVYIPPTNGPFFKVENPIFESKRTRKIWLPLLLILGAVTVGGMFIGHFFFRSWGSFWGAKKEPCRLLSLFSCGGKHALASLAEGRWASSIINHGTSAPCAAASASSDTAESR